MASPRSRLAKHFDWDSGRQWRENQSVHWNGEGLVPYEEIPRFLLQHGRVDQLVSEAPGFQHKICNQRRVHPRAKWSQKLTIEPSLGGGSHKAPVVLTGSCYQIHV